MLVQKDEPPVGDDPEADNFEHVEAFLADYNDRAEDRGGRSSRSTCHFLEGEEGRDQQVAAGTTFSCKRFDSVCFKEELSSGDRGGSVAVWARECRACTNKMRHQLPPKLSPRLPT